MTRPSASISGPPELPGLIAASVWMTSEIVKPLGALIWRCRAEMMPEVTVRSSPYGLPIAIAPSPTLTSSELPSVRGLASTLEGSTERTATSVESSTPSTFAGSASPSPNFTVTDEEPSTTCALVRTWPSLSMRIPEPVAVPPPDGSPKGEVEAPAFSCASM